MANLRHFAKNKEKRIYCHKFPFFGEKNRQKEEEENF
jgi:hypothetical protein